MIFFCYFRFLSFFLTIVIFFPLFVFSIHPQKEYPKEKNHYSLHPVELTIEQTPSRMNVDLCVKKMLRINQRTGETFFLKVVPLGNRFSYYWVKIEEKNPYKNETIYQSAPLSL